MLGRRVARIEDPRLLRGAGRYTADVSPPGAVQIAIVRSPVAHARLRAVDLERARRAPGVVGAWEAADLERWEVGEMPVGWISAGQLNVSNPLLAHDTVRYVGQPIAVVAADSAYAAEDAAELVELELEELPTVLDVETAVAPDAPLLHPDWGSNVFAEHHEGGGDPDSRFDGEAVVVEGRFRIHRHTGTPLEGRCAVAQPEPDGRVTAWLSMQVPHHSRTVVCQVLGWGEDRLRVIAPDVGGGFGVKEFPYAEDALVCLLADRLGRPVRWVEDRREHFLSAVHAREQTWHVELAADADGRVRAIRGRVLYDAGGHSSNQGIGVPRVGVGLMPGPYDIRHFRIQILGVVTNKVPAGAYRGFGRPQATFVIERLLDRLAARVELDPAELRRRNLIGPERQPYANICGHTYDGGDYPRAFERALELIDHDGFRARQHEARAAGRLTGIAATPVVVAAGLAPSAVLGAIGLQVGGYETVRCHMDPTGKVTLQCGSASQGQGHATTLAQACAGALGLEIADVDVHLADTDSTPYAPASAMASRVGSVAGGAVLMASRALARKLARIAAHMLEADSGDVELEGGEAFVRGSRSRSLPLAAVAHAAHLGHDLPEGIDPGLETAETFEPPSSSYPYATHAATVELDPATGALRILRYVVVSDCGTMLNPSVVEGQIRGAVAQGIGGAVLERLAYDAGGQLLTTSFMDYLLPTALDVPPVEIEHLETPATGIPGGMKGIGEAGIVAPAAVLAGAVADAVGTSGPELDRLPLDPERTWRLSA